LSEKRGLYESEKDAKDEAKMMKATLNRLQANFLEADL
jgi:hypothetical protein